MTQLIGTNDTTVVEIDEWLCSRNLPKLSTHMTLTKAIANTLFIVYKSTNTNALIVSKSDHITLNWLMHVHVDVNGEYVYSIEQPSFSDIQLGCRVNAGEDGEFALECYDSKLHAIETLDEGWRTTCCIADDTSVFLHYLYMDVRQKMAYALVEDTDRNMKIAAKTFNVL